MDGEEFLKNIKYGLIAVDKDENKRYNSDSDLLVFHFCGYIEQPTEKCKEHLYHELKYDDDLKLENIDDIVIVDAPEYVVTHFKLYNYL